MKTGKKQQNPNTDYGPNNPEPLQYKESAPNQHQTDDALHAAVEYINRQN